MIKKEEKKQTLVKHWTDSEAKALIRLYVVEEIHPNCDTYQMPDGCYIISNVSTGDVNTNRKITLEVM